MVRAPEIWPVWLSIGVGRGLRLQPLGLRQVLRLPFVEGRDPDPMLAANVPFAPPTSYSRRLPTICSFVILTGLLAPLRFGYVLASIPYRSLKVRQWPSAHLARRSFHGQLPILEGEYGAQVNSLILLQLADQRRSTVRFCSVLALIRYRSRNEPRQTNGQSACRFFKRRLIYAKRYSPNFLADDLAEYLPSKCYISGR